MNNSQIEKYFMLAKNASNFSDFPRIHIGCVLIYKNKILSVGWNTKKENPLQKYYNKYRNFDTDKYKNPLHAEMMSILKIRNIEIDWKKVNMFIYREHKNGKTALAKPCKACKQAIKDTGIKNIYYTSSDGYIYEKY